MRCVAAISTSLALVVAFFLAPFQHVHPDHLDGDHEHSAIIHTHLFLPSPGEVSRMDLRGRSGVRLIAPGDEDEAAFSVNTFTSVTPVVVSLVRSLPSRVTIFAPKECFAQVEFIEERGHDPPFRSPSAPRAPPS